MQKEATRVIAEKLASPDETVRRSALEPLRHAFVLDEAAVLGKIVATAAVPTLTLVLRDPDAEVRNAAAQALGEIGPKAASALQVVAAVVKSDPDMRVRHTAVWTLHSIGPVTAETATALQAALNDPAPEVREQAARVLGIEKEAPPRH